MTDNITRILVNAKKIFRTKNNNLSCVVIADDENGIETNYILNFNYDGITLGRTIVNNNKIEVITNNQEYNKDVFSFVLRNFNTLMGDINEFNNTVNFTLNTIPAMVFSNSVFKKEGYDGEEIYDGDKYIDDFISYNNRNNLIDSNNYFTFLKFTVEAGNLQIFDYLRFTYNEYMNNLNEEQMAILIYTACKRNPEFIEKMHDLNFTFGFEVLKLAVDNNDCETLEYLYDNGIDINTVVDISFTYSDLVTSILDYAFAKDNIEMVKYLLTIKDINIRGNIILNGIRRNPELIEILFKREDIYNILRMEGDFVGRSIAHEIAENRNPKIVKLLFEIKDIGNILNIKTHFIGRSVAHVIAKNEDPEIVKCLLERKDIDDILSIKDKNDYSVADALAGNKNPEAIEFLLTFKNIKLKNESINSIKENFGKKGKCGKNEKIMKLLNLYKLNKTTNLFEKKEEKTCTIC